MKPTEAIKLTRLVKALCPAQAWDEGTPDVWAVLLAGVPYRDAEAAVAALGSKQRFIAPAEVIDEVRRVRRERTIGIDDHRATFPGNPDDVHAELEWWRASIKRVADGEHVDQVFTAPVLEARSVMALEAAAGATFRRPPRRD